MKLLDLYCGEGLAAWGYWRSGRFSEVVGVDINPVPGAKYAFDFVLGDCLALTYEFLDQFDFIHASPPCQAYSYLTPDQSIHMRLVAATKLMLHASGKPHVIENVQGAMKELRPNLSLDGHSVGLPIERRRYFYVSGRRSTQQVLADGEVVNVHGKRYVSKAELIRAFGLTDWISPHVLKRLTIGGIEEGIPPAMTHYIIESLYAHKFMVG
jgi:DNA (cytosine-5)-methyltransferase 1